jgi:hypothetical protein
MVDFRMCSEFQSNCVQDFQWCIYSFCHSRPWYRRGSVWTHRPQVRRLIGSDAFKLAKNLDPRSLFNMSPLVINTSRYVARYLRVFCYFKYSPTSFGSKRRGTKIHACRYLTWRIEFRTFSSCTDAQWFTSPVASKSCGMHGSLGILTW